MKNELLRRIEDRSAVIGVIGLGYVGLPLAVEFAKAGFHVIGYDIRSQHAMLRFEPTKQAPTPSEPPVAEAPAAPPQPKDRTPL